MLTTKLSGIDSVQSITLVCSSGLGGQSDSEAVLFKEVSEQFGVCLIKYKSIKFVKFTHEKQIGVELWMAKLEISMFQSSLCQAGYEFDTLKICRY